MDDLIRTALEEYVRPRLRSGFPEWQLDPLDPFHIDRLPLRWESGSHNYLDMVVTDTDVTGLADFVITFLDVDTAAKQVRLSLSVRKLLVKGHYTLGGKLVGLWKVKGEGPYHITLTDVVVDGHATYTCARNLQISGLTLNLDFRSIATNFENLQGGGRTGRLLNWAVSKNARLLLSPIRRRTAAQLQEALTQGVNGALRRQHVRAPSGGASKGARRFSS